MVAISSSDSTGRSRRREGDSIEEGDVDLKAKLRRLLGFEETERELVGW